MSKVYSLRKRIRSILIIGGLFIYVLGSLIIGMLEVDKKKSEYALAMVNSVDLCKTMITDYINRENEYIKDIIATMPDHERPNTSAYLKREIHLRNLRDRYYILGPQNHIIYIDDRFKEYQGFDLSHIDYISNQIPVSRVRQSLFSQKTVVSFLHPLPDNKKLVLERDTSGIIPIVELFNVAEIIKKGEIFILSAEGTVIYHPDRDLIKTRHNLGFELEELAKPDSKGIRELYYNNQKYLYYKGALENPAGWTVYFTLPKNTLVRDIFISVVRIFLVYAALSTFLLLFLLFFLNKRLSNPVDEIVKGISVLNIKDGEPFIPQSKTCKTRELFQIIEAISNMVRELNKSHESLKVSEERYRVLVETLTDIVFTLDVKGRFTYISPEAEKLTGRKIRDLIGHPFIEILAPEYIQPTVENFNRGISGEKVPVYEVDLVGKGKKRIPVELKVTSLADESGAPVGRIGVARDIKERRIAEKALRDSEERYRAVFENTGTAMVIFEEDFTLNIVNRKFEILSGFSRKEVEGRKNWREFIEAEDLKKIEKHYSLNATGNISTEHEIVFTDKSGKKRDIFFSIAIIPGTKSGVASILDITEKNRLETQLQQAQRMESIGTLAGGIAHDFNNLLMVIQGNTSLMLMDAGSMGDNYQRLKSIERAVQSGSDLTSQLLGFARGGKYHIESTNLNKLVKEQNRMFSRARKEINIRENYDENLWAVDVDRGQIQQVLLNLYLNSWQAMPGGGDIYVKTENVILDETFIMPYKVTPGKYVKISISDTGIGMDKETQERIFEPFFTTKSKERGTGLGLASVYGIIKNHKGFINVYSDKGQGATFSIYFPASGLEVSSEMLLRKKDDIHRGHETILLVDDEDTILDVGEEILKELGYTVVRAKGGIEAVKAYRENRDTIDMVILDMIMPDMGGGEVYDQLKELNPEIKVLLSSGYSIDTMATEIMNKGCNGFIQKPFNVGRISQKIREILSG